MWALFFGHAECASLLFGKSNWESKNKNGLTVYDFHKASVMVGKDGYSSLYQYQQQHQCSHPALIAQFQASQPQVGSPRSLVTHAVEVRSASEPAVSEAKKKPNQKSRVTRQITKNAPSDSLNGFVAKIKNLEAQIASKDEFIQILRKEIGELKSLLAKQEVPTSSTTTSGGSVCIIDENKGAPSGAVGEAQNEKREDQENRQNQLSEHAFFNARKARIDFLLNKDDETILIPN